MFGIRAALWKRWCEDLKQIDRKVPRELREEAPSYDRIRFFLTAPGADGTAWLRLPHTFDAEDHEVYVRHNVMGRQTRALNRACWGATLRKPLATAEPRKAGAELPPAADGSTAARAKEALRNTKVASSVAPSLDTTPPSGRPFTGPALTQEGRARAMAHAPKTHDGSRVSCRDDAGTHRGCPQQDCKNAWVLGEDSPPGPRRPDGGCQEGGPQ